MSHTSSHLKPFLTYFLCAFAFAAGFEAQATLPVTEFDGSIDSRLQGNFEKRDANGNLVCEARVECKFGWHRWTRIGSFCDVSTEGKRFDAPVVSRRSGEVKLAEYLTHEVFQGSTIFPAVLPVEHKARVRLNDDGTISLWIFSKFLRTGETAYSLNCDGAQRVAEPRAN